MWNSNYPSRIPQKRDASGVPKSRALAAHQPVVEHQAPTENMPSVAVSNTANVAVVSVNRREQTAVKLARALYIRKMYDQQMKMYESEPVTPYMTTATLFEKLE
jgi:hypothetical protein